MNVWRCPRCPYTTEQPAYVTAITHRCRPEIPRAYRLVLQVDEHERTSDDS